MEAVTTFVGLSDVKGLFSSDEGAQLVEQVFCVECSACQDRQSSRNLAGWKVVGWGSTRSCFPLCRVFVPGVLLVIILCTRANEHVCRSVSCLDGAVLASDRGGPVVIHVRKKSEPVPHFYVYVDNLE